MLFVGSFLPKGAENASDESLQRLLEYFIKEMNQVVQKPFVIVYCHTGFSWFSGKYFKWLRNVYGTISRPYKKNLQNLYIVHPTMSMRSFFFFCRPFISVKFWRKLQYCDNVTELMNKIAPIKIRLPDFVRDYDSTKGLSVPKQLGELFGIPLTTLTVHTFTNTSYAPCVSFPSPYFTW